MPGQQAPAVATYRDTVVRLVERPPIVVTGMRPRVRSGGEPVAYVENEEGDTILIAQPFVMEADTVQGNDTIQVRASFPPPSLSIAIRQGLDTLHELNKTMVVQLPPQYITREPSWIEKVGYGLIGAAVGAGGVLVATW